LLDVPTNQINSIKIIFLLKRIIKLDLQYKN
jgi:hypothetical protein